MWVLGETVCSPQAVGSKDVALLVGVSLCGPLLYHSVHVSNGGTKA